MSDTTRQLERDMMVEQQLVMRDIRDERVLAAMRNVPRHRFVPEDQQQDAYADRPLPIGEQQTISQPYIVAYMTEQLSLKGDDRVLEIGTGCGYQTAILAELVTQVWTVEILEALAQRATDTLTALGYTNISYARHDGHRGWDAHAPYDAILVAAAADRVPPALTDQLALGRRLILPVGADKQILTMIRKTASGLRHEALLPVSFVPMTDAPGGTTDLDPPSR